MIAKLPGVTWLGRVGFLPVYYSAGGALVATGTIRIEISPSGDNVQLEFLTPTAGRVDQIELTYGEILAAHGAPIRPRKAPDFDAALQLVIDRFHTAHSAWRQNKAGS